MILSFLEIDHIQIIETDINKTIAKDTLRTTANETNQLIGIRNP